MNPSNPNQNEIPAWARGMGGVSGSRGGNYFHPGKYRVRLNRIVHRVSAAPATAGHVFVIPEFTIREVLVAYPAGDGFAASNVPGENASQVVNLTKHGQTAAANVKNLLLAIIRTKDPKFAESSWDEVAARAARGERNADGTQVLDPWAAFLVQAVSGTGEAFSGIELEVQATRTLTKAKNPFTALAYSAPAATAAGAGAGA